MPQPPVSLTFFFFNDPATTEIYPLPLHDALPICAAPAARAGSPPAASLPRTARSRRRHAPRTASTPASVRDRKSTRLNSSHSQISYAVFCLKKKQQHLLGIPAAGGKGVFADVACL